jgi:hypothetical protein
VKSDFFCAMINGNYEGELVEGVRQGQGAIEWSNGDRYDGDFQNGLRHGKGVLWECPVPYSPLF